MSQNLIQLHNTDPVSFKNEIVSEISKKIDALEKRLPIPNSEWISRKQAADLLGVSLVTISDWTKKDILKAYRIGNRVRFKMNEIEDALNSSRYEFVN
ncbi:MAG: DNA-binding protein [Aequorivita sp.]|mgnify:CR=1 FL=1|nr:DNA-binding protein [Aequorivita sp.]|tara:strand:+ start:60137 stop:60430 length:294 start_codon:yes stop_codon:yes gene_type:complete